MSKHITQAEAKRLRKRVEELEAREHERANRWGKEYPRGGVHIATVALGENSKGRLEAAQMLRHPLVCRVSGTSIYIWAMEDRFEES